MRRIVMKKLAVLLLGGVLTFNLAALCQPNDADQKWLGAVQKMVAKGDVKVSTPNGDRLKLLQEWGSKSGYTVKATKTETGYNIEVSKNPVQSARK
jgi:hypothetical protein